MRITSILDLPPQLRDRAERELAKQGAGNAAAVAPGTAPKKASKYRNEPVYHDDQRFDSKLELRAFLLAEQGRAAGEVLLVLRQVPFYLEGGVRYVCDLALVLAGPPHFEIWDAKGHDKQDSRNKRKQVLARHGVRVLLWPKNANESKVTALRAGRSRA